MTGGFVLDFDLIDYFMGCYLFWVLAALEFSIATLLSSICFLIIRSLAKYMLSTLLLNWKIKFTLIKIFKFIYRIDHFTKYEKDKNEHTGKMK